MRTPSPSWCGLDRTHLWPTGSSLGDPIDYGPELLLMPFGFHLAMDTLPSGDRKWWLQVRLGDSLRRLAADAEVHYKDLESLEQRLTVLEEKMMARARTLLTEDQMLEARQELDRQLRPYRGKMTADPLSMLEKQYLERNLLEKSKLPRLSLFYMR